MSTDYAKDLIQRALDARRAAYAPYSGYSVGAALLTTGGEVVIGCNVENASYGLTVCAERIALFTAVAAGHRSFRALAVATGDGASMCGACRQVLCEFGLDLEVHLANGEGQAVRTTLRDLLPNAFGGSGLPKSR